MVIPLIKKFYKQDTTEGIILKTPPKLVGGAFFYGKIRAGKTTAMMTIAQKYYENLGYKIFDLFGGQRNENMYWTIPNDDLNYWSYIKKKLNVKNDQEGPKQYKVNLLYPYFSSKFDKLKELPHDPPNVKSKLFTIPLKEITPDDIKLTINVFSETALYYWRETLEKLKDNDSHPEFVKLISKISKKRKRNEEDSDTKINTQIFYKNMIEPLMKENFLQSKNCSYNLDIIKEIKDRETISVLCLNHVPPIYHLFIAGWILRQVKENLDLGKIPKKNIFIYREVGEYFRVKDDSITDNRVKWFRKLFADYVRYGRRGMHMFADCQSPAEVKGIVEGSADLTFMGRIPATSREDRAAVAEALYSVGKITKKQIEQISDLRPGEFFLIVDNNDAVKRYILLPRTLYWKEKYSNFNNVWKSFVDKWENTKIIKEEIDADIAARKQKIKEKEEWEKELDSKTLIIKDIKTEHHEPVVKMEKIKPKKSVNINVENNIEDDDNILGDF